MPEPNSTGIEVEDVQTEVISLDGAKIPLAVVDPEEVQAVLNSLNLTAPFGYNVESIKLVYKLSAKSA